MHRTMQDQNDAALNVPWMLLWQQVQMLATAELPRSVCLRKLFSIPKRLIQFRKRHLYTLENYTQKRLETGTAQFYIVGMF